MWQLVDSNTLKPYLIAEVENGKKNGLFAFGSSKSGIVTALGHYEYDEREGYYRHFSDSGVRSSVFKFSKGIAIDTDYVYNVMGDLYHLRIMGSNGYKKIISYNRDGRVASIELFYEDSSVSNYFEQGHLKYNIKLIGNPPTTIHTVFNTNGSIKSTATFKPK